MKLTSGSNVAVIGLGRVGQMASRYLLHHGIHVYAYDDNQMVYTKKENQDIMMNSNFTMIKNNFTEINNKNIAVAISSPGVSNKNKMVQYCRQRSVEIIDEIEFTWEKINNPLIAITGTNGKSTTTSLLGRILQADGKNCFWGGNLAPGLPYSLSLFQECKEFNVIEVSSFQLERCTNFHPNIAILLNINQDHLDRHTSFKEYRDIKFKIFNNQNHSNYAIINHEDKVIMNKRSNIKSKLYYFSNQREVKGAYVSNREIYFKHENICSLSSIKLLGSHFIDSILPAICAAKLIGVKNSAIRDVLHTFNGLEHRLEFVAQHQGTTFINNSMCTNPIAGQSTLKSFRQPVILITGGKEKNLKLDEYLKEITKKTKHVILIGENRNRLAKQLNYLGYRNLQLAKSLKDAVINANQIAQPGDIILFSPAFASFDLFTSFQERGRVFKEIVYGLK